MKTLARNALGFRALDAEFDRCVLDIATDLLPGGFDAAADAPSTFDQLIAWLDGGNRMRVWNGASEYTIFGAPEVNYAFRAWHDFTHYQHRLPFTLAGEAAVVAIQIEEVKKRAPDADTARRWIAIILGEILGQIFYAYLHGEFPGNQRLFARQFLQLFLEQQARVPGQQ